MGISVYSVLTSTIWVNILIVVLLIAYRKGSIWRYCGVGTLIIIYSFCCIRLLLPLDLPWMVVIASWHILASIRTWLVTPFLVFGYSIQLSKLFMAVWMIGIAVMLCKYTFRYIHLRQYFMKLLRLCGREMSEKSDQLLTECGLGENQKKRTKIWLVKNLNEPVSHGILSYDIMMPDIGYSDSTFKHILRHECMHIRNHDLMVKSLLNLLCVVYWWNPFMYMLRRSMNRMFEIRCDSQCVEAMDKEEIVEYLTSIVDALKGRSKRTKQLELFNSFLGYSDDARNIEERFDLIVNGTVKKSSRRELAGTIIVAVAVLVLSYSFIIQPAYAASGVIEPGEEMCTIYEATPQNMYIRHYANDVYTTVSTNGGIVDENVIKNPEMVNIMVKESGFRIEEVEAEYEETN